MSLVFLDSDACPTILDSERVYEVVIFVELLP